MTPSNPITHNGKEYNEYQVSLSSTPIIRGATYTTAVNFTLRPMRLDEETNQYEVLNEKEFEKQILLADVRSGDAQVLNAFGKINSALQELVNAKNW